MTKRRKPKKLSADKLVRTMARARLGAPPPKRVIEDKRRREKHKPDLEQQQ
jgi:hypothetical protein